MKLITCNGRTLEVRDLGLLLFRLVAYETPIKAHGIRLMDDGSTRKLLRELLSTGLYDVEKVNGDNDDERG